MSNEHLQDYWSSGLYVPKADFRQHKTVFKILRTNSKFQFFIYIYYYMYLQTQFEFNPETFRIFFKKWHFDCVHFHSAHNFQAVLTPSV